MFNTVECQFGGNQLEVSFRASLILNVGDGCGVVNVDGHCLASEGGGEG